MIGILRHKLLRMYDLELDLTARRLASRHGDKIYH